MDQGAAVLTSLSPAAAAAVPSVLSGIPAAAGGGPNGVLTLKDGVLSGEFKGGTPVIRGTRMTVYSVLGRIEHGDTIDAILAENPDLTRDALEAAVIYARTHPLVGRPSGRPWVDAE